MIKEQLEILLKAKSIMEEQAIDAIEFLSGEEVDYAVNNLHKLYIIAITNNSPKAAKVLLKGLVNYLDTVKHPDIKALILIVMATDHVFKEEYNQAIALYYEYKKLNLLDAKLDYHFDSIIFEILYTNNVTARFHTFAQRIANNPYLYEIDPYYTIRFFYHCAVVSIRTFNRRELKKNIESIKQVMTSRRPSIYTTRGQLTLELLLLVEADYQAKNVQEREQIKKRHQEISETYIEFDEFMLENIEVQLVLLKSLVRYQEYDYVIQRLKRLLNVSTTKRIRISMMRMLSTCYKQTNSQLYVETVMSLNQLLTRYLSNYQIIVNEGLLNSLKFYDIERDYIEIQNLYEKDMLTKAFSRNVLFKNVHEMLSKNKKISVVFFDLDNLKHTNDTLSHIAGDQFLKSFTLGVKKIAGPEDQLFRYGGDEFVLVTHLTDPKKITSLLDQIFSHFAEPLLIEGQDVFVKFSAGIARYPEHGSTLEQVLRAADQAMYFAKRRGGGYEFYETSGKLKK